MSLLNWAEDLLEANSYETWQRADETDLLYFEDHSVLGMISEYYSVEALVSDWEMRQDRFLREYAEDLRGPLGSEKVWNAYTIHLTVEDLSEEGSYTLAELENRLFQIEEDFGGTRKIARCGLETEDDLIEALLPLVEIQNVVELRAEDYRDELQAEIGERFDARFKSLLADKSTVEDIADSLLEEE